MWRKERDLYLQVQKVWSYLLQFFPPSRSQIQVWQVRGTPITTIINRYWRLLMWNIVEEAEEDMAGRVIGRRIRKTAKSTYEEMWIAFKWEVEDES